MRASKQNLSKHTSSTDEKDEASFKGSDDERSG